MVVVDYNVPVTVRDLDLDVYEEKFRVVERYKGGEKGLLPVIMNDITMFSYLFFRVDGKPLKLFAYQDAILNDPHRFKIFRAARQIGKSLGLDVKAAYNLCVNHGHSHNEGIISASLKQAGFQMRRVKSLLNSANFDWRESKGMVDNMSEVTVDIKDPVTQKVLYTNLLVITPNTGGALGYDFHEANLDETEYWQDTDLRDFFNNIIEPTISSTKGRLTTFSNPNGADTYVAELENHRLPDGSKKYHTYTFNYLDRPGNTREELDVIASGKTRQEMESQYLAVRTLSDRNFFTHDEIIDSEDKELSEMSLVGKQPFFFLDLGYTVDQSCLVGGFIEILPGYDHNNSREQNRPFIQLKIPIIHLYPKGYPISLVLGTHSDDSSIEGWERQKSVKEYLDEWRVGGSHPPFGFDATGNKGMVSALESAGIQYKDVIFSGPDKSAFYTRFKYLMEKRLIKRRSHSQWVDQAKKCIAIKSVRGYWLINSKNVRGMGGDKKEADDCLDATAGLIAIADPENVEESLKII